MIPRPDLLPKDAPDGMAVYQLTHGPLPASHVYMEAQIFSPDSRFFLLHESAHAHGSSKDDPNHRYLVCDLENDGRLTPLTQETGATAPSVSPDGRFVYYFVNETEVNAGRLILQRVGLDGSDRQELLVMDRPLPDCGRRPSRIYPLSTIRSDGRRLALSCFLGDGTPEGKTWGLLIFDLEKPSVKVILTGESWCNMHPQYCRSRAPENMSDILVQENHDNIANDNGEVSKLTGGLGADIHLIKDDGTQFRNLPWGRDGNEFCQGHQCWRGASAWAITSTGTRQPPEQQLIEARAVPAAGHLGLSSPGDGKRNHLSRSYPQPCFFHFATDAQGRSLVTDTAARDEGGRVLLTRLGKPGEDAAIGWRCVAMPHSSWVKGVHIHPFLAPDGKSAFFNSDESGQLQAYMVRGLPTLP